MQKLSDENPLYSCFVSPGLCLELSMAGFAIKTTHRWNINGLFSKLSTDYFDPDGYYRYGNEFLDYLNPPDDIVPAYTIMDCVKVLPPFGVAVNCNGDYQLGVDKFFAQIGYITATRLPDVFAKYVLKAVQQQLLDIITINQKFSA